MPTYQQIVDDAIAARFNPTQRALVQKLVNDAGRKLWDAWPWDFKLVRGVELTLTADTHEQDLTALVDPRESGGSNTALHITRIHEVMNENGDPLERVDLATFSAAYPTSGTAPDSAIGVPVCWSYETGFTEAGTRVETLLLGPAPDTAWDYTLNVERGWVDLVDADDVPRLPDGGRILVPGAIRIGLAWRADPSKSFWDEEYQEQLVPMVNAYVNASGPPEYPRDSF